MATTPHNPVLTLQEAQTLALCRSTVQAAKNRLGSQSFSIERSRDAFELGFLWQALDAIEDATFEALNVAESYLDCTSSQAVLNSILKRGGEPAEVEL